jgi:hypothetical protein
MRKTATFPDEPDPRPTTTAPVGAALRPGAVIRECREGLRAYGKRYEADEGFQVPGTRRERVR